MIMQLPQLFIDEIKALTIQEPRVDGLIEALGGTAPTTSVRFSRTKSPSIPEAVAGEPLSGTVPWCPQGRYLSSRPVFILDPAIHQGLYYVQDASSMFISHVIRSLTADSPEPIVYLDACAAPGGKTTAAIDSLPQGSLVVANEWDFRRAEILRENLIKWGYPAVIVSRGDTRRYSRLHSTFDIIAADVPCSGEGMMRKDPEAVTQWSPALIDQCTSRQREIIDNLWPALRPGGYLIYSTCTFNRSENEEIIDYITETYGAIPVAIPTTPDMDGILPGIGTPHPCYRFMPHLTDGEGLFMAVLRKPDSETASRRRDRTKNTRSDRLPFRLPPWIPDTLHPRLDGNTLYGIPPQWKPLADTLSQSLDIIMQGVELATVKGRDLIPSQGLAMSTILERDRITTVEADRETALAYLRRDTLKIPEEAPKGHILLTHNDIPLGWVKNLGSRANNLYPPQWRILRH